MTVTAIALPIMPEPAGTPAAPAGDSGQDATNAFAALIAGMLAPQAIKIQTKAPPEGLSELEQPDVQNDDAPDGDRGTSSPGESATAPGATASDPNAVVRAIGDLTPALQQTLKHIMERMRDEAGHTVQVRETYRTQARQDTLFAQGRITPGAVVTWTRHSKHSEGRAVDVTIDGGNATADAYATLQRIAREEGLKTLGARDPGHLELPGSATRANPAAMPARVATVAQVAQLASVAKVASVATVGSPQARPAAKNAPTSPSVSHAPSSAQLAQPAQPAQPAQATATKQTLAAGTPPDVGQQAGNTNAKPEMRAGARNDTRTDAPAPIGVGEGRKASSERGTNGSGSRNGSAAHDESGRPSDRGVYSAFSSFTASSGLKTGATREVELRSTAAERVEHVRDIVQDAPARPMSQITLSIDAGNGQSDRVHVALRGHAVDATIDAADRGSALQMHARSEELTRALARDGLEMDQLTIRGAGTGVATAASPGSSDASFNQAHTHDRSEQWHQQQQQQQQQQDRQRQQERQGRRYQPRDERTEDNQ